MPTIEELQAKIQRQAADITQMRDALHEKNVELDAMHYIWCDGGCETGAHRWTENTITEEVVQRAERSVRRLRAWFENHEWRKTRAGQRT